MSGTNITIAKTPNTDDYYGELYFDFPALKHWEIDAYMKTNIWLFGDEGQVELKIDEFDFDF